MGDYHDTRMPNSFDLQQDKSREIHLSIPDLDRHDMEGRKASKPVNLDQLAKGRLAMLAGQDGLTWA